MDYRTLDLRRSLSLLSTLIIALAQSDLVLVHLVSSRHFMLIDSLTGW
jgi:hypothetical protein